jgi:hypothetical protein
MQHAESIHYSENFEKEPLSRHGLQPYEIEEIEGEFVACLPVAGTRGVKGKKDSVTAYAEIGFSSEEEAHKAVTEARKDLGLDALN